VRQAQHSQITKTSPLKRIIKVLDVLQPRIQRVPRMQKIAKQTYCSAAHIDIKVQGTTQRPNLMLESQHCQ
jgi:hypothetical protein